METNAEELNGANEEHNTNPQLGEDVMVEDVEKIKGDAVGNTLYSERWVLKTLIRLSKIAEEEWSDDLETDLCSLWDMTTEKDVVDYVMKHDIMSLIISTIRLSINSRVTEIMAGILGNMCCFESVRRELAQREDVTAELMSLFAQPDTHVLIQLVRLLHSNVWDLVHQDGDPSHWLSRHVNNGSLSEYFYFILRSSTNDDLLSAVIDFLHTVCCTIEINDTDFSMPFAKMRIISSLLEAWKQLFGQWAGEEDFSDKRHAKAAAQWTAILCSFTGHEEGRQLLCGFANGVGSILSKIVRRPADIVDTMLISIVNILDCLLPVYFDGAILKRLLDVLNVLLQRESSSGSETFEDESSSKSSDLEAVLQDAIEEHCVRVSLDVNGATLKSVLMECNENLVLLYWKCVNDRREDYTNEKTI